MAEAGALVRTCLQKHMVVHKQEYGEDRVKPKHHWALDIADLLMRDRWMFDAFVIERLHLRVRATAENVKNLATYSSSVLSGMVNYHSHIAQRSLPGCGLVGKTISPDNRSSVLLSDHMDVGGKTFSVGDFACRGEELGCVVACCVEALNLFAIVDLWRKVAQISQHSSRWESTTPQRAVWRAVDMLECVAWERNPDCIISVIHM